MIPSPRIAALAVGALALTTLPALAAEPQGGMCNGRSDPNVVVTAHANGSMVPIKFILNLTTDPAGLPAGTMVLGKGAGRVIAEDWCRLWQHVPGQQPGHDGGDGHEPGGMPGGGGHEPGGGCAGEHDDMATEGDHGATIVHAVGAGLLTDGSRVRVRVDARGTDEGLFFRVRYKPMGAGHGDTGHDESGGCSGHDGTTGGCGGGDSGHEPGGMPGSMPGGGEHEPGGGCAGDGGWTKAPAEGWYPLTQLRVHPVEPEV